MSFTGNVHVCSQNFRIFPSRNFMKFLKFSASSQNFLFIVNITLKLVDFSPLSSVYFKFEGKILKATNLKESTL